jgi:hypothetical protein
MDDHEFRSLRDMLEEKAREVLEVLWRISDQLDSIQKRLENDVDETD